MRSGRVAGAPTQDSSIEQLRAGARDFCDRKLRPGVGDRDRSGAYPRELLDELAAIGFLGMSLPERWGGLGLGARAYVAVTEELGAADPTARSIVSVSVGLAGGSLASHGSPGQKEAWLPRLAAGELGAFALTEPEAGSNPAQVRSKAVLGTDGWILNGAKTFITNGSSGALTLVFARAIVSGEDRGLTCFLVPQDVVGYSTRPLPGKLGLRSGDTAEVTLDGVRLSDDAVLGEVGKGMRVALSALDSGRLSVAAGAVGLAREALDAMLGHAIVREQFGRAVAGFQLVQAMIADSHVDVQAARTLVEHAAGVKETGARIGLEASTAKLFATEAATRCADRAVQVHGGYGYIDEYPASRLLRDARVLTLYEGTSEIQRLLIGRELTGISAFA